MRKVSDTTGMPLNEYVTNSPVTAAVDGLADRRVFTLDTDAWEELQEILNQPTVTKLKIAALPAEPSLHCREDIMAFLSQHREKVAVTSTHINKKLHVS